MAVRAEGGSTTGVMARRLLLVLAVALAIAPAASASEIIDRNASDISLKVGANGQALISYKARGQRRNVLVWGAVNAIAPHPSRKQLAFRLDYSGGWGTYKRDVWKTLKNACRPYDGPKLAWFVMACKAPDGSYWALQSWQRMLPNYGLAPTPKQAVWELRLSHWKGAVPVLDIHLDWSYRRYHHLYGSFRYAGQGVFGFRSTRVGVPLDTHGRNVYLDTYNSAYGGGWKRENSFLTHQPTGTFCYGFYPHGGRPIGAGERYRATVIGPGLTPDVMWESAGRGPFDAVADLEDLAQQREYLRGDNVCKPL
jgi:hypothetical protein